MEKKEALYEPTEYVALKKITLKYIGKDEFKNQMGELLDAIRKHQLTALAKISVANWDSVKGSRSAIVKYLKSITAGSLDEVINEFRIKAESNFSYRTIYCGIAGIKDTEEEAYLYWLTHQAKCSNEVEYREVLKCDIIAKLQSGKQLTKPENDWLVYVLEKSETPHESKGAPKRNRDVINRQYALAGFILNDITEQPKAKIKTRLERAAKFLCTSQETVRADYYSTEYKKTYEIRSKLQVEN